jgi:hypothetical protein
MGGWVLMRLLAKRDAGNVGRVIRLWTAFPFCWYRARIPAPVQTSVMKVLRDDFVSYGGGGSQENGEDREHECPRMTFGLLRHNSL